MDQDLKIWDFLALFSDIPQDCEKWMRMEITELLFISHSRGDLYYSAPGAKWNLISL